MELTSPEDGVFLSTMPVTRSQRQLALAVVLVATILFLVSAPFAKVQLQRVDAFIPVYETGVIIFDLITAILLFGQFAILRSRAILILASGYLFTSTMTLAHMLSFPGLVSPKGLLGAGAQTTVWLYVFWHVGFALFVIAFALVKEKKGRPYAAHRPAYVGILSSICLVLIATGLLTLLATAGQGILPPVMDGNRYGPGAYLVALGGWPVALLALVLMLRRGPRSVLDLWVMVVMCVQVLEVALSATLNGGQFDLGFYLGRIYGLAACFKPFNDSYGHLVGDRCLRMVAEVLARGARRSGETIARYGGDEFAILLPRTDLERASALARHLCKGVRDMGLPHAHSTVAPHVTITIGVASVSIAHQTDQFAAEPTVLVETADRALYSAKAAGRDCVIERAVEAGGKVDWTLPTNSAVTPSFVAKS